MAENKTLGATFITGPFILSYPKLTEAVPYMENGKPKGDPHYTMEAISDKASLADWVLVDRDAGTFEEGQNVEVHAVRLCKELFGADFNVNEAVKAKGLSWPFKSGDAKAEEKGEKGAHYRGKKFWRAKAKEFINGVRNEVRLHVLEEGGTRQILLNTVDGEKEVANKFYGGAICTAEVNLVVGETNQGRYATIYVNSVIFNEDGERLGGESNVARFYGVKGGSSQTDPTAGLNKGLEDEIPF